MRSLDANKKETSGANKVMKRESAGEDEDGRPLKMVRREASESEDDDEDDE